MKFKDLVQKTYLVPPPPELIVVLALVLEVLQAVLVLGSGHLHKFVISGLEAGGRIELNKYFRPIHFKQYKLGIHLPNTEASFCCPGREGNEPRFTMTKEGAIKTTRSTFTP